jgi:hypothetical protein
MTGTTPRGVTPVNGPSAAFAAPSSATRRRVACTLIAARRTADLATVRPGWTSARAHLAACGTYVPVSSEWLAHLVAAGDLLTVVRTAAVDGYPGCGACWECEPGYQFMRLCSECGCKRCPHANSHRFRCSGSNDVGQPGSAYEFGSGAATARRLAAVFPSLAAAVAGRAPSSAPERAGTVLSAPWAELFAGGHQAPGAAVGPHDRVRVQR